MGLRHVGLGAETTYGTAVTPTRFFEALSESINLEQQFSPITTIRAYSPVEVPLLSKIVRGDMELLANYHGVGLLFKYLVGSVTTTTGSVNTHTFPATTGIPSTDRIGLGLTIEKHDGALVWTFAGCKISSFKQQFSTDQASRMTVSFIGKTATTASSYTTASYSTLAPIKPAQISVLFDGTTLSATSANVAIENPVDEPYGLGSTSIVAEPDRNDVLKVSTSVDIYFTDFVQYNKFMNASDVAAKLYCKETTYSLTYNLNKCRITSAKPQLAGRDRLKATFELESFFDATATENVQVVLVNADSTP